MVNTWVAIVSSWALGNQCTQIAFGWMELQVLFQFILCQNNFVYVKFFLNFNLKFF